MSKRIDPKAMMDRPKCKDCGTPKTLEISVNNGNSLVAWALVCDPCVGDVFRAALASEKS